MLRNIALKNADRMQSSYKEHLRIIDLLTAREYDQAWETDREHLIFTGNEIKSFLYMRENKSPGRVGIFGGSFDPIHIGHLDLINTMRSHLDLQKVILLPAYRPTHKQDIVASYEDRMEMCRLVAGDDAGLIVEDTERRISSGNYFCDILRYYKDFLDDIFLIVGPDTYLSMSYWKNNEYIIKNSTLCTFLPGKNSELLSCSEYFRRLGGNTVFLNREPLKVSSTSIRADIRAARDIVPPKAYRYIMQKGLYR